jgi:hypothetical protein
MPRPVTLARKAFLVAGIGGLLYVILGIIQLRHLTAGLEVIGAEIELSPLDPLSIMARGMASFIRYTVGLAVIVALTMLPFGLFIERARNWSRVVMIITCYVMIAGVLALLGSDAYTLQFGDVVSPVGTVDAPQAERFSALLVAPWFPPVHYVVEIVLLVAAIVGAITLSLSDSAEYFRRWDQVTELDPRVWSISQLKQHHD